MKEFYTFPDPSELEAQRKALQNKRSKLKNEIAQRTKLLEIEEAKREAASTKSKNVRGRMLKVGASKRQNDFRNMPGVVARHIEENNARIMEQTAPLLSKLETHNAQKKYLQQLSTTYESMKATTLASLNSSDFIPGGKAEANLLAELAKFADKIRVAAAEYNLPVPAVVEEPVVRTIKTPEVHLKNAPRALKQPEEKEESVALTSPAALEEDTTETPPVAPEKRWVRNPNMYPGLQERGRKIKADALEREAARKQKEAALESKLTGVETEAKPEAVETVVPIEVAAEKIETPHTTPTVEGKKTETVPHKKENVLANATANREGMSMEQKQIPKSNRERLEDKLRVTLPGFDALPEGKKLLVLQGMEDSMYAHVKEHGKKDYEAKRKEGNVLQRSLKSIFKNSITAKREKEILDEINSDTNGRFTALIKNQGTELLKQFSKGDLTAYLSPDKKSIITDFTGMQRETGRTPLFYSIASEYNEASSKLARIPYEWSLADATSAQRAAYKKAEQEVHVSRDRYLTQLEMDARAEGAPSPKAIAAAKTLEVDTAVKTMRFLSAHPEVAKKLNAIENKSVALRALIDTADARGKYFVAGFAARKIASLSLSLAAAPIISSAMGYWRGKDRAKGSLRDRTAASRRGDFQKGSMSYGTGSAQRRIDKLNETKAKLEGTKSPLERQNLLSELKTQVDFINAKIELGQLNFGKEEGRLGRQFEIMQLVAESQLRIEAEMHRPELAKVWYIDEDGTTHIPVQSDGDARRRGLIERMGAKNQEDTTAAQKEMVRNAAIKGLVYGGLFASAGVVARHFGEEFGWFGTSHHNDAAPVNTTETADTVAARSGAGQEANPFTQIGNDFAEKAKALGESYTRIYKALTGESQPGPTGTQTIELPEATVTPSTELSESVIGSDESLAHVTVSSRGIGQTILNFRNSPEFKNLTPEQQKFFEGNVYKVAEKLKELDPKTGRGVSVGAGSEFGINKHGEIYITDTNEGGRIHEIGALSEDGSLSTPYDYDITNEIETPTDTPLTHTFTSGELETISYTAGRRFDSQVADMFGSKDSQMWSYVRGKSAAEIMAMDESTLQPAYRKLHAQIATLMQETGQTDFNGRTIEQELQFLNDLKIRGQILGTGIPATEGNVPGLGERAEFLETNGSALEGKGGIDQSEGIRFPGQMSEHLKERLIGRAQRHFTHELDKEFGSRNFFGAVRHSGVTSEAWKNVANQDASTIFEGDLTSIPEEYRDFLEKIRSMAEEYPSVSKNMTVGEYVRDLYQEQTLAKYLANRDTTLAEVQ